MKRHVAVLFAAFLVVGSLMVVGCDEDADDEEAGATQQEDDSTDEANGATEADNPAEQFAAAETALTAATDSIGVLECECTEDWDDHFMYDSEEECLDNTVSEDEAAEFESCLAEALEGAEEDPPDELSEATACMNDAAAAISACEDEIRGEYDDICEDFDDAQSDLGDCTQDAMEVADECFQGLEDELDEWGEELEDDVDECYDELM